MKSLKAIFALLLALMLLSTLALAEADATRFEELVAANSMEARFSRHSNMQVNKSVYYGGGDTKTEMHIMAPDSHYFSTQYGNFAYLQPDLHIVFDPEDDSRTVEWLHDSEEAYRDNFDSSIEPWNLGVGDEDLLETHEADGVFTARTAMADPDKVDAMLSR